MKSYVALALAATTLATPRPQEASAVAGCSASSDGSFQIQTFDYNSSQSKQKRQQLDGEVSITLKDGILKDQAGRQGYIASNYQFQFDPQPQPNALQSTGFALCGNNSLALGGGIPRPFGDTAFWQCLSGDFYNLYSDSQGMQCIKIYIQAVHQGTGIASSAPAAPPATSGEASKPTGAVSQLPDGQPQASSAAPKSSVVSQIPDGQFQTSKSAGPVVSQIPDGQPQATQPASPVVSQIPDGQPQATKPTGPIVSQIPDGQPQATKPGNLTATATNPSASGPLQFTGAAAVSNVGTGAFAAGLFGLFALL